MASGVLVDAFYNAPECFWSALNACRKRKEISPEFAEPRPQDPIQTVEVLLQGSGVRKAKYKLKWDMTMQHTISWSEPICVLVEGVATWLKPGSCNLYQFPKVTWASPVTTGKPSLFIVVKGAEAAAAKAAEVLDGPRLVVLKELFLAIARDPFERNVLKLPDWSGANSVLGLLVANTDAAVDVCCRIFDAWPELMAQPHLHSSAVGITLQDAVTNATLCELSRLNGGLVYGGGEAAGEEAGFLVGMRPCRWGSGTPSWRTGGPPSRSRPRTCLSPRGTSSTRRRPGCQPWP